MKPEKRKAKRKSIKKICPHTAKLGRPTKMTEKFIKVTKKVLGMDKKDSINTIIFTDEELIDEINEQLEEGERISKSTFSNWKANSLHSKNLDEKGKIFLSLIKKSIRVQKKFLFQKFKNELVWQKWAWIIERKYDNWNIRHKTEHSGKIEIDQSERRAQELIDEASKVEKPIKQSK